MSDLPVDSNEAILSAKMTTPSRLWSCLYCGSKFDSKMKLKNHGIEVSNLFRRKIVVVDPKCTSLASYYVTNFEYIGASS